MKSTEKNMKQNQSHSPVDIKWVMKTAFVAMGLHVWGVGFVWVIMGVCLCWGLIKSLLKLLFSLAIIIGLIILLFTI